MNLHKSVSCRIGIVALIIIIVVSYWFGTRKRREIVGPLVGNMSMGPSDHNKISNPCSDLYRIVIGNKTGYIDHAGIVKISPQFESGASKSAEGLICIRREDNSYGFVDQKGIETIVGPFDNAGSFANGAAPVLLKDKWGFIDKDGIFIIEPKYDYAEPFVDGCARVGFATLWGKVVSTFADVGREMRYEYIDKSGQPCMPKQGGSNSLFPIPEVSKGKKGYLDPRTKAMIIQPSYDKAQPFSFGLAAVEIGGKWGYINPDGSFAITPTYDWADPFDGCMLSVVMQGKIGYVDTCGRWIWSPTK